MEKRASRAGAKSAAPEPIVTHTDLCSLDIGSHNFAYVTASVDVTVCREGRRKVKEARVQLLDCASLDFFPDTVSPQLDTDGIRAIIDVFRHQQEWEGVQLFVPEQQFFGGPRGGGQLNLDAIKIAEMFKTYIVMTYPDAQLSQCSAQLKYYHKTPWYEPCAKGLSKKARKQWSVDTVQQFILPNQSRAMQDKFEALEKKDDVADTIVQLYAYVNKHL